MASRIATFSLFPTNALRRLGRSRGRGWSRLVESIADLPETHPEHMAYTLMMRRLSHLVQSGNQPCFMPGCSACALDVLEHFEGSERDLLDEYRRTLGEIEDCLAAFEEARQAAVA